MSFYGDQTRWFLARVVDWEDSGEGRVKIRIIGLHSESIPFDDLPWAKCVLPTTEGGVSGIGKIPQIVNSAFVFGIFLDGKVSQVPIVLGSLNHIEELSSEQNKKIQATGRGVDTDRIIEGIYLDPSLENLWNQEDTRDEAKGLEARAIIAMKFLIDNGIEDEKAAAGIVGNLIRESNILPEGKIGKDGEEGIAQWNPRPAAGNRLRDLKVYARDNRKDYTDFFLQLNFLVYDMKTSRAHGVWNTLSDKTIPFEYKVDAPFSKQDDITNATLHFLKYYEAPADISGELLVRQEKAEFAWSAYQESKRITAAYVISSGAG